MQKAGQRHLKLLLTQLSRRVVGSKLQLSQAPSSLPEACWGATGLLSTPSWPTSWSTGSQKVGAEQGNHWCDSDL